MNTVDPRATLWSTTAEDLRAVAEHYRQRATEPVRWWQFAKKRYPWTWQRQWDAEIATKLDAIADEMAAIEATFGHDIWKHDGLRAVVQQADRAIRTMKLAAGAAGAIR